MSHLVSKVCLKCSVGFKARKDRPGLYCSRSCAGKDKNQISHKLNKLCEVCNKEFIVKRYRKDSALYCSNECRRKRMPKAAEHPMWKGGISERKYSSRKVIRNLKKCIAECQKCGSTNRLQGHHIIKHSENKDLANDQNNILILCISCHANEHPEIKNFILKGEVHE